MDYKNLCCFCLQNKFCTADLKGCVRLLSIYSAFYMSYNSFLGLSQTLIFLIRLSVMITVISPALKMGTYNPGIY